MKLSLILKLIQNLLTVVSYFDEMWQIDVKMILLNSELNEDLE